MRITKAFIFSVMLFALFILTGCGAKIEGKISINSDGSGNRTIVCRISQRDISRINGGEKALDEIINKNKPSVLTQKKTMEGEDRIYTFSYNFKDFNEYLSKTQQITGKKPESSLLVTGSGFSRNYSLTEKSQTLDLLRWAIDEVERSGVSGLALGEMYQIGSTEVNLLGYKQYFTGDIKVEIDKQFSLEGISVDTKISSLKEISRSIKYIFSEEVDRSLNINGELSRLIEGLVPRDARYQRTLKDSLVYYEISFSSGDLKDLNAKTRTATMDERASLFINNINEKSYSINVREIVDSIDFMRLTGAAEIRNGIMYSVRIPANFNLRRIMEFNTSSSGGKIPGVEIKSEQDFRVINYGTAGNDVKFNLEYTTPRTDSYLYGWIVAFIILGVSGFLFVKLVVKRRVARRWSRKVKEDTLSFDNEWKIELEDRLSEVDRK